MLTSMIAPKKKNQSPHLRHVRVCAAKIKGHDRIRAVRCQAPREIAVSPIFAADNAALVLSSYSPETMDW